MLRGLRARGFKTEGSEGFLKDVLAFSSGFGVRSLGGKGGEGPKP